VLLGGDQLYAVYRASNSETYEEREEDLFIDRLSMRDPSVNKIDLIVRTLFLFIAPGRMCRCIVMV
jgi:hypothetical protein